jgi:diguanylate cyclase (GGDEF)-like protein
MQIKNFSKRLITSLQSRRGHQLVVAVYFAAFLAAFIFLHPKIGPLVSMFGIIPPMVLGWYYGARVGIVSACVLYVLEIASSILLGWNESGLMLWGDSLVITAITIAGCLSFGRLGKLTRRHQGQIYQNRSLLQERRTHSKFLALLNDILQTAIETDNMASMLNVIARRLGGLFNADDCYITLWNEEKQATIPLVAYGDLSEVYTSVHQFKVNERTLTAAVLDLGHALTIEDIKHTDHLSPDLAKEFPNRSAMGLPLISGNRKLGAVILGYDQLHRFTPDEMERGELVARQIALMMTKSLLLEEARQRVHELAGLHSLSQLFTLHGDSRRTYGLLTETLARHTDANICVISLYDSAAREIYAQTPAFGIEEKLVSAFHYPAEVGSHVWNFATQGGIFRVNSVNELPVEFLPLAQSLGLECILVAPLWDSEKYLFGVIFLANKKGGFNDNDNHLLEVFANQVAVVIHNTHLLEAERKRAEQLAALQAIANASTEADHEDQLIESVTQIIGQRLYPDNFGVLLLDAAAGDLSLHSSYRIGLHEGLTRVPLGVGITGAVARSGTPCRVDDVALTPEYLSIYPLTRSELCVPLKVEDELLGVINAESNKFNAFTREDEELLTIIAGQLAMAIQRLRAAQAEHHQTQQLERSESLIRALAQVNARAAAASDPDGVMQTLGNELSNLGMRCMVALSDASNQHVVIRYVTLPDRILRAIERLSKARLENYPIPTGRVIPYSSPTQTATLVSDPIALVMSLIPGASRRTVIKILKLVGITETTSVCHLPLVADGKPVGILWMWGEGLHESDLPTFSLFASQLAASLQRASLLTEVQRLARIDEGTGIFNRRHFFELARREFAHAQRYKRTLSALILDIDHFKRFNDQYGHTIGDLVLHEVAQRLQAAMREGDILGRYGGEEFSILLPETEAKSALAMAKRLIKLVTDHPIHTDSGELTVYLSIGVAGYGAEMTTLHDLINRADQAMYLAKDAGRNGVVLK